VVMADAETEATIASIIANDVLEMDSEATPPPAPAASDEQTAPPVTSTPPPPTSAGPADAIMEDASADSPTPPPIDVPSGGDSAPAEPEAKLPVPHIYYFLQIFDAANQVLRVVGSYFSRVDENVRSALRHHLRWPEDKDFLVWLCIDNASILTVSPTDTFWTPTRDGICFIVGERLTSEV
jgi:hypothetical protein